MRAEPADELVALAATRPAHHGVRVVGVEGRSGSGKTTFAELVADAVERLGVPRPPVLHMDSLYPGWAGLERSTRIVAEALAGLRSGVLVHPTWDWASSRPGPSVRVAVDGWLVVEGIGCGSAPARPYLAALAWLDLPDAERKHRALARDGDLYAPHWDDWADQEEALLGRDDIRAHADLRISTAG